MQLQMTNNARYINFDFKALIHILSITQQNIYKYPYKKYIYIIFIGSNFLLKQSSQVRLRNLYQTEYLLGIKLIGSNIKIYI